MKKLDASRMYAVGYALQHGLAESITFDYDVMCPFLALVVSLDTDKDDWSGQPASPEWLAHVQKAYNTAANISWSMSPEKPHAHATTTSGRAALDVVKTDLESLRAMIKASADNITQYSARNLNHESLPRPLSPEDAISRLTVGPGKTSVLSGTDQMFCILAEKFYDLLVGPVSQHVDVLIHRVESVVLDEEVEGEDEEDDDEEAMQVDVGIALDDE